MNAHVFNSTADELRASIYGYSQENAELQQIRINAGGELMVAASNGVNATVNGTRAVTESEPYENIVAGTSDTALADTDISQFKAATIFVDNTGGGEVTVTLQLSPDGERYFNDPSYTDVTIEAGSYRILALSTYAQIIQLAYAVGEAETSFTVYFNGQV